MSNEILKSIEQKLDTMLKLSALQYIKDKPKEDQANILLNLGLSSPEVGKLLGKSASTIRVQKKQKKDKKKPNNKDTK